MISTTHRLYHRKVSVFKKKPRRSRLLRGSVLMNERAEISKHSIEKYAYKQFMKNKIEQKTKYRKYLKKMIRTHLRTSFEKTGYEFKEKKKVSKKHIPDTEEMWDIDIYDETGVLEDIFLDIWDLIKDKMNKGYNFNVSKKKHKLSKFRRFLLVLTWLRQYPNVKGIKKQFKVSDATISREVDFLLPILVSSLNVVKFPTEKEFNSYKGWEDVIGAVDGTGHPKWRTHPKCMDYYRGDKGKYIINSMVLTSAKGNILHFTFTMGHNNDQGTFNMSWLKKRLILDNLRVLGDGGYHGRRIVKPTKKKSKQWNNTQKQKRSIVEIVIGYIKNWGVARDTFRGNPEKHTMALWVVYQIAAWKLKRYPIRF